jgi:hypothetical protein
MRRALTSFISTVGVIGLLSAGALTAGSRAAEACPNEAFRTGYSAALPDCRAYELVSPPGLQPYFETFGEIRNISFGTAEVGAEVGITASQSSSSSKIAFFSIVAEPGALTDGPDYLSSRSEENGEARWTTKNLIPPQSPEVTVGCLPYMIAWSANLERGILADGYNQPSSNCGTDEPELVPGEPREGRQNLFLRDTASNTYQLLNQAGLAGEPANATYQSGSSDLGIVVFSEEGNVGPEKYYVWAGGTVDRPLTVLPNGSVADGAIADAVATGNALTNDHAVAPDGSRVEFTAEGDLYSRLNPGEPQSAFDEAGECDEPTKACTIELDSSENAGPGGGGVFEGASGQDGDVVYFTDENQLTSDSTASAGAPDLYEYDFRKPFGERLTDLTVDQNLGEHADVLGYIGSNETGPAGEYVYFIAAGVLASNPNSIGAHAATGLPNLYMAHEGATTFVATLSQAGDFCDWENRCMTGRVSANGRYLGFDSLEELTGLSNVDANTAESDQEIYLYDEEANLLSCASCGTTGAPPIAPASIRQAEHVSVNDSAIVLSPQRNVSNSGQVFFDTPNPLLPGARNGRDLFSQSNVYEYEHGQLYLLSSGTAESSSFFYEATAAGEDAYLVTTQALAPGGNPVSTSLYDAKVDGGSQPPPSSPEPCSGETCSGPQAPGTQPPPAISSASLFGQGNLEPAVSKPAAARSLTSAQKLAKALKSCRAKRNKRKRGVCEERARKRYGPLLKKSAKTNRRGK